MLFVLQIKMCIIRGLKNIPLQELSDTTRKMHYSQNQSNNIILMQFIKNSDECLKWELLWVLLPINTDWNLYGFVLFGGDQIDTVQTNVILDLRD